MTLTADIKNLGFDSKAEDNLINYAVNIEYSIEAYLRGDLIESYQVVDNLLCEIKDEKGAVSDVDDSIAFCFQPDRAEEVQLFRARINDHFIEDFDAREMLHIPFGKRKLVATQRFSIPGLPCLYLGNTSYCCWIELGKPADFQFNVSPVLLNDKLDFLNLIVTGREVSVSINEGKPSQEVAVLLKLLMLNIATSFTVLNENRSFKTEYVFPQMLMLACKKEGLDGIIYYSKRVKDELFAMTAAINVVLFTTYSGDEISDICNSLSVGKSFNYSMYKQLLPSQDYLSYKMNIDSNPLISNIGEIKRPFEYRGTWFYRFDKYLFANWDKEKDNWK